MPDLNCVSVLNAVTTCLIQNILFYTVNTYTSNQHFTTTLYTDQMKNQKFKDD